MRSSTVYLRYRNYVHASGEAAVSITKQPILDERGERYKTLERWTINGELQADSQSELTAAIAALETAYSIDGGDLALFFDDASLSAHVLLSGATIGGNRVVGLAYPVGDGAEYSTFRSYQIVVEGERPSSSAILLAWDESLTFAGGGPRFRMISTLNGPPQKQIVNQRTPFTLLQEGRAVQYLTYPLPPGPIAPGDEHRELRRVQRLGPRRRAGNRIEFETTWSYFHESASPLAGNPSSR